MPEHGGAPNELRFTRVFDAPRELVFRCMTDPDHLTHFWGPKGVSTPRDGITVDARPGGVFETVMVNDSDGNEYATRAVYDEVRPPERLSWTEAHSGMRVTTEFVALGPDRTEVRIHQRYVPEAFLLPEVQAGFLSSLDRFDAYLAGVVASESAQTRPDPPGEGGITMTCDTALHTDADLAVAVAEEYGGLADLLEASDPAVWDVPSLCEGWRTREVVAHMTMPARYAGPAFMAELEAAGGDFTRLSNTVAARDGALPVPALLADLRSEVLHAWQPPGGGMEGALTHCVIHGLDIIEAVPLARRLPDEHVARVLGIVAGPGAPNLFGVDLSDVALRADDLDWSCGSGAAVTGPAQALALVACGRLLPPGRLGGEAAHRFTAG